MSKRKAVEDMIISYIGKIVTGDENVNLYKDLFKSMNDKQFEEFMIKLRDKKLNLPVIIPNGNKNIKVDINNNIKIAKELGYEFFQHLKIGATEDLPAYTTPNKYMIIKLPIRRAAQLLTKKISIPTDAASIDTLSGQVTGKSKGSKLSYPEIQILVGIGLKDSIKELMKMRGGDLNAAVAMNESLFKYGKVTQELTDAYGSGVVSKKTLNSYLNGMHIRSTLNTK